MRDRTVRKWIERHGASALPDWLSRHLAGSDESRRIVEEVCALDKLISEQNAPDPGEAYWANFAPSVARRLEEKPERKTQFVANRFVSWRWTFRLVAGFGVVIVAIVIGRDMMQEPKDSSLSSTPPAIVEEFSIRELPEPDAAPAVNSNQIVDGIRDSENQKQSAENLAFSPVDQDASHRNTDADVAGIKPDSEIETAHAPSEFAVSEDVSILPTDDLIATEDTGVWPRRQITRMGEVETDVPGRMVRDPIQLAGRDGGAINGIIAETVDAAMPGRLVDGPGIRARDDGFTDSNAPAEAMRRLNEIQELRFLISELHIVRAGERSSDEMTELCALWYRLGQITEVAVVVDSAITVLDNCLISMDSDVTGRWLEYKNELINRRNRMP